jgi:hypothetical protein
VTRAAAALAVIAAAVAGCSGPSDPTVPLTPASAVGNPADTASPEDTAGPVSTDPAPVPVVASTLTGAPPAPAIDPGVEALASCLNGNWTAPVAREFGALGLSERTGGAVRSGTGLLWITFGRDETFRFTYDQVTLSLAAGQAVINGPVTGTWSLQGNTLQTAPVSRQTKVEVKLGPVTVGAPGVLVSAVEAFPPGDVLVTCDANRLGMQRSSADGGGIVEFDRA